MRCRHHRDWERSDLQVKLGAIAAAKEIEEAVLRLSADELAAFQVWVAAFEADVWDRQIEADAASEDWTLLPPKPLRSYKGTAARPVM